MNLAPIFHCKKCRFLTHSGFVVSDRSNVFFSDMKWQCCGCGDWLAVSHMTIHNGDLLVMGDVQSFDILVAHILEIGKRITNQPRSGIVFIDESKIPPAFSWAKALVKKHPQAAFVCITTIANLLLMIYSQIDARKQHRESMDLATDLAKLQMEHATLLAEKDSSELASDLRRLSHRVSTLIDKIASGELSSDSSLRSLINEHNNAMERIGILIEQVRAQEIAPALQVETTARGLASVGRNQPCPCGSGKKYKKCHLRISLPQNAPEREATEDER